MKKILIGLLIVIVILFVAKDMIVKAAVPGGVKAITGLDLDVKSIQIGLLKTSVGINGLQLDNPAGFQDKVMADLPEIFVDYNLGSIIQNKIHLEEVRLNLKEFVVVKNAQGELNINTLRAIAAKGGSAPEGAPKEEKKMPEIKIDLLNLKIGKVVYKDYSKGAAPLVKEFNVNLDEQYRNITDPKQLVSLIVFKALAHTSIAMLANFDMGTLKDTMGGQFDKAKEVLKSYGNTAEMREALAEHADKIGESFGASKETTAKAKDAINEAAERMKSMFPFGSKEEQKQ